MLVVILVEQCGILKNDKKHNSKMLRCGLWKTKRVYTNDRITDAHIIEVCTRLNCAFSPRCNYSRIRIYLYVREYTQNLAATAVWHNRQ